MTTTPCCVYGCGSQHHRFQGDKPPSSSQRASDRFHYLSFPCSNTCPPLHFWRIGLWSFPSHWMAKTNPRGLVRRQAKHQVEGGYMQPQITVLLSDSAAESNVACYGNRRIDRTRRQLPKRLSTVFHFVVAFRANKHDAPIAWKCLPQLLWLLHTGLCDKATSKESLRSRPAIRLAKYSCEIDFGKSDTRVLGDSEIDLRTQSKSLNGHWVIEAG